MVDAIQKGSVILYTLEKFAIICNGLSLREFLSYVKVELCRSVPCIQAIHRYILQHSRMDYPL